MRARYNSSATEAPGRTVIATIIQWWWWRIWWQKISWLLNQYIISDWFPSHGILVMMMRRMTIKSEQGTLLIISQIYFHYLPCHRSIHNVFKTIWVWFYQVSLSEMIIKPGSRGLAWGKPRYQLTLFCSALWGIVTLRGRWLSPKQRGKDNQEQRCNFVLVFDLLLTLEGLHKNLTDLVYVHVCL